MLEEYKYKTELHAHTSPVSGCSQILPETMAKVYSEMGYDTVALTNHFLYNQYYTKEKLAFYMNDYYKLCEEGKKYGINIVLGAEIRFSDCINDYLIYGIDEHELEIIDTLLSEGIDNFYKVYKSEKNVIIHAHPFRDGMEKVNPKSLDGIEVFNMHPGHNSRIAVAAKYAKEHDFIITAGSDFHHEGQHALSAILTKEPITDSYQLAKVLNSRDYLIDLSGIKVLPYEK